MKEVSISKQGEDQFQEEEVIVRISIGNPSCRKFIDD